MAQLNTDHFQYEDSVLSSHAAALQIGYANGNNPASRDHGRIYRHVIKISGSRDAKNALAVSHRFWQNRHVGD